MLIQLPNEQDFFEMDIDYSKFKLDKEIGGIKYGWYNETYIAIKSLNP